MKSRQGILSTKDQWSKIWLGNDRPTISFNPDLPNFRDYHRIFQEILPKDTSIRFLEIGCYPGKFLWYFHNYFGYQVSGIEYIKWASDQVIQFLRSNNIDGDIINSDFFDYHQTPESKSWNVVSSFGFIEHFHNTLDVVKKHFELVIPGGYMILSIPNLSGFYGHVMKIIDNEQYCMHNRLSGDELIDVLNHLEGARILISGYVGHLGFWNTGLYPFMKQKNRFIYLFVRGPLWILEALASCLPNNKFSSPNFVLIAKKTNKAA